MQGQKELKSGYLHASQAAVSQAGEGDPRAPPPPLGTTQEGGKGGGNVAVSGVGGAVVAGVG